jgi:hypothetical protein
MRYFSVYLREWQRVDRLTKLVLWAGIITLIVSTIVISYGNRLAGRM